MNDELPLSQTDELKALIAKAFSIPVEDWDDFYHEDARKQLLSDLNTYFTAGKRESFLAGVYSAGEEKPI